MDGSQTVSTQSVNDGLATAALLGANRGYSEDGPWKGVVGGGICDLREAVAETRADIRESIQTLQSSNAAQFAHVHEKACDAEKEAIKAQYEGRIQTVQTGKEVENRVSDLERNVDTRFCDLEKTVMTEASTTRAEVAAGFAAVALSAAKDAAAVAAQISECCCENKLAIADLKLTTSEQFGRLSNEHLRQTLIETKDELTEARFEAILAKIGSGNGNGNGKS